MEREARAARAQWDAQVGLAANMYEQQEQQEPPPHPVRVDPNPRVDIAQIQEDLRHAAAEVGGVFYAADGPPPQRRGFDASHELHDLESSHGSDGSQSSVATSEALEDTELSDNATHAVPATAS